jgi:hypothetical protein
MRPGHFFQHRVPVLALAAAIGFGVRCSAERPPERTLAGLAQMLGHASGTVVSAQEIRWEASPGVLRETFFGRRVLFLGARKAGEPRDVYRASVRVSLDGKPFAVREVRNLTDTSLGDDAGLELRGSTAAFATVAYGNIQSVTLLEMSGARQEDRAPSWFHRLLQTVTSYQEVGSLDGLGRTDVVLELPAKQAELLLDPPSLRIDLGEKGRALLLNTETRELVAADGGQAYAARTVVHRQHPKPLILWGVDTVRAEVGPEPIAWLEDKVFGAKDKFKRTTYQLLSSGSSQDALKEDVGENLTARVLDATHLAENQDTWPPPPVPTLWKETKAGEGEWQAVELPFLRPLPGTEGKDKPPAYFYRTFIRPDTARPYSEVMLIAMDMRQLELGMEAGFEDPKPLTGPPGGGRLPRDESITTRIVGTFNGAFKTTHGKYGMMVNKRVLLPPVPGGATVMVEDDGAVGLGSWPKDETIPDQIVSYRQNLDPLVEDGVANPTGRNIWGWQLSGTSVMTQRTALCVTAAGHLYYAFGPEIDGPTLGKALRQAGCSYGVHLDMNPGHCGFVFTDIVDIRAKEYNLKKAHDEMKLDPAKFVRWSAKDFFYVMVRDPRPKDPSGVRWKADTGVQPPPNWMPGVFSGELKVGNLNVQLVSFEPGRVDLAIRSGSKEPSMQAGMEKKFELKGADAHKAIAAINLGHTTEVTRYGLAFEGTASLDLRATYATLVVARGQPPRVLPPGSQPQLEKDEEAAQLPLLAEDGKLTDHALARGAMRARGALCVTRRGRTLVALARHDSSDSLAAALIRVGCKRVLDLDRGSQHPAFVHRASSATPPLASYETSVLYALGRPMEPHAFRWKAEGSTPSTKPTGYDVPAAKKKPKPSAAPDGDK